MHKNRIVILIVLMGIALSGIIGVQIYWLEAAIQQNEQKFDRKVNDALQNTINNLEKKAIEKVFISKIGSDSIITNSVHFIIETNDDEEIFLYDINDKDSSAKIPQKNNSVNKKTTIIQTNGKTTIQKVITQDAENKSGYAYWTNSSAKTKTDSVKSLTMTLKTGKFKDVIEEMFIEYETGKVWNVQKKIKPEIVSKILKKSLKQYGINIDYAYMIKGDMYSFASKNYNKNSPYKKYSIKLFPDDLKPKADKLVIYFPDRKSHLVRSLSAILPLSLIFSLVILIVFSLTLMMLIKQKKISDVKTDFINNMTHEFKTPIATISLAADAIINPKVISHKEKIRNFIQVIKNENKRMNIHVERVLQMSLLDKSKLELHLNKHDLHELIMRAVENMQVQIDRKNGNISTELKANYSLSKVDELHFINIITNLLDNAVKYSDKSPEIKIKTQNHAYNIEISVSDKGIGMSKEEQKKIFERFYRAQTGNIHKTKGFGLGLSYVKAIMEAFQGSISVQSEKGKGSRFILILPTA